MKLIKAIRSYFDPWYADLRWQIAVRDQIISELRKDLEKLRYVAASLPTPDGSQYKLALLSTQAEAAELRKQLEIATVKLNVSKLIKESTA
jgi:hypothetical protein